MKRRKEGKVKFKGMKVVSGESQEFPVIINWGRITMQSKELHALFFFPLKRGRQVIWELLMKVK